MFAAGVDVAKHLQLKNAESYGSMKSRKKVETKIQEKIIYTEDNHETATIVEQNDNTNYFVGDGVFLQYQPDQYTVGQKPINFTKKFQPKKSRPTVHLLINIRVYSHPSANVRGIFYWKVTLTETHIIQVIE